MDTIKTVLERLGHDLVSVQAAPLWWVHLIAFLIALGLIMPNRAWPISRNLITIAHEGGHALVALLTGRRLAGIQLHSDTSGVTVSAGRPNGFGMILTAFAGYVAPSLLGLGAALLLAQGRLLATLWVATVLLALMFVMIRNLYGAMTVAVTGLAVFGVSYWTPTSVQALFACTLVWFLLLAGPRPVYELQRKRSRGQAPESDADQLAVLTSIPGIVWVGAFFVITLGSLGYAAAVLLY